MGLSPDPAKRARQLANIKRAWPKVAANHGLDEPPPSEPRAPAGVTVLPYADPEPEPSPPPEPEPSPPEPTPEPESEPAAPEPELELEPEREGFWSGFFGAGG